MASGHIEAARDSRRWTLGGVSTAEKAIEIHCALDQREHLAVPLIVLALAQIHQCHGSRNSPSVIQRALMTARETGEPQMLFQC
ncbi:hypothetical protein NGR_b06150 (plasmid) [Sinorhizobium fredii NGR234]|uniref:Uncharacterized protein n=1 Tax=Sinorhizobium fredii (strain NBRC 101917 / NGR234) TaxID=394 RepID=C3KPR5_SINFN|nr:hypothetical protein NGR_b06150 [Sinorhizobium fredii NGR234]